MENGKWPKKCQTFLALLWLAKLNIRFLAGEWILIPTSDSKLQLQEMCPKKKRKAQLKFRSFVAGRISAYICRHQTPPQWNPNHGGPILPVGACRRQATAHIIIALHYHRHRSGITPITSCAFISITILNIRRHHQQQNNNNGRRDDGGGDNRYESAAIVSLGSYSWLAITVIDWQDGWYCII